MNPAKIDVSVNLLLSQRQARFVSISAAQILIVVFSALLWPLCHVLGFHEYQLTATLWTALLLSILNGYLFAYFHFERNISRVIVCITYALSFVGVLLFWFNLGKNIFVCSTCFVSWTASGIIDGFSDYVAVLSFTIPIIVITILFHGIGAEEFGNRIYRKRYKTAA